MNRLLANVGILSIIVLIVNLLGYFVEQTFGADSSEVKNYLYAAAIGGLLAEYR